MRLSGLCAVILSFAVFAASCGRFDRLAPLRRDGTLTAPVGRQPDGRIIVPTNQVLDPAGFQIEFPSRPVDLWLAPDGRSLVVKNRTGLIMIETRDRIIRRTLTLGDTSFHGIAVDSAGEHAYLSLSEKGVALVHMGRNGEAEIEELIELPKDDDDDVGAVPGGLALTDDEKKLCVTFSRYNTLGIIDLDSGEIEQVPVGIAPYGVLLDGSYAFVSNWAGRRPREGDVTGPTSGSRMVVDPETYIGASGTISVVDIDSNSLVETIDVGLHPSGMAINKDRARLYVANANSDTVSVIDTIELRVIETIPVRPDYRLPFGSAPNALDLSPDGKRLYVANGSNNSIAVIELSRQASGQSSGPAVSEIAGFIPTGWYPGAVRVDSSGRFLYVANVKGVGSLNQRTTEPAAGTRDERGSVSIIPIPDDDELAEMTKRVHTNNRMEWSLVDPNERRRSRRPVPVPLYSGQKSVFKHVIYIIKENRTYDQIFGDIEKGNGDPRLCLFGEEVTPNHHALAEEFTLFDNFYCSGILSADGHHWATAAYATDYLEKSFGGWPRSYPYDGDDMMANSAGGFIWDKVLAKGLTFRNYGEMVQARIEPSGLSFMDIYTDFIEGRNEVKLHATTRLKNIEPYICPDYIGFPGIVPDIKRADVFIREFKEFEEKGELPNFIVMLLPNDHTMGTRPGRPTPRAAVADNDLALGRIIETITRSKFWPETCIFVTEDDPQAGLDHVDGHRTIALVISPYTKRGYVDSTNYNQTGMLRTMELILGLEAMNQLDLSATPMVNAFRRRPNFKPYEAVPNRIALDELNPQLEALSGPQLYWAKKSLEEPLDEIDEADEDTLNRIIWHAVKGYDVPYPAAEYGVGEAAADQR